MQTHFHFSKYYSILIMYNKDWHISFNHSWIWDYLRHFSLVCTGTLCWPAHSPACLWYHGEKSPPSGRWGTCMQRKATVKYKISAEVLHQTNIQLYISLHVVHLGFLSHKKQINNLKIKIKLLFSKGNYFRQRYLLVKYILNRLLKEKNVTWKNNLNNTKTTQTKQKR